MDEQKIAQAKASRKVKKAKVTRLVNQIRQHIKGGINVHSIKKLRSELKEAIEMMEMSNEVLYLLEPDNEEHDQWFETALQPAISCLSDIEGYIQRNCETSISNSEVQSSTRSKSHAESSVQLSEKKAKSTTSKNTVYFQIVPVMIEGVKGTGPVETYAILDAGSSDTLLRKDIAEALQLDGPEHRLTLGNVENNGVQKVSQLVSLRITPTGKGSINRTVNIDRAWTVPRLNIPPRQLVNKRNKQKWTHLHDLDIPAVSTDQVGILIGVDVPEAMIQHEYRKGLKGQPYAVRTDFGWAVAGAEHKNFDNGSNQIHVGHVDVTS